MSGRDPGSDISFARIRMEVERIQAAREARREYVYGLKRRSRESIEMKQRKVRGGKP